MRKRSTCRICNKPTIFPILNLGNQAVSNFTIGAQSPKRSPLQLVICDSAHGGCGLVQLAHRGLPRDLLFRNYWYHSGINEHMRHALESIVRSVEQAVSLSSGDIVCDIGANDGTLLRAYKSKSIKKAGFEPARNLFSLAQNGTNCIINDYFSYPLWCASMGRNAKAKVITTIAMVYDLEEPHIFVEDIRKTLSSDGLWINEMTYFPDMVKKHAFDTICHEHIEYYTVKPFLKLLDDHNLNIQKIMHTPINGGSIRCFIGHKTFRGQLHQTRSTIRMYLAKELSMGLDRVCGYQEFHHEVHHIKDILSRFVARATGDGEKVAVYGASTKGNTILQYLGLTDKLIAFACDRNSEKWGRQTVATNIPIISEEEARKRNPDYFLVLPWHFRKQFIERERAYLQSGGRMIFPIPTPQIVSVERGALTVSRIS